MKRVLVCGGRDYVDSERAAIELGRHKHEIGAIIEGGVRGADAGFREMR